MNILKHIGNYLILITVLLLSTFGYMRIILGPKPKPAKGLMKIFDFYDVIMVYLGSILGIIIALLYIILDVFYLRKKLENNLKSTMIRCLIIMLITTVVGAIHYSLEKIIDVI